MTGPRVLLMVTGGIAAYKSCFLARLLMQAGFSVQVAMTEAGTRFVSPLTFQALSGNPVHRDLLDTEAEAAMGHIDLARWAPSGDNNQPWRFEVDGEVWVWTGDADLLLALVKSAEDRMNVEREYERNRERYTLLRWAQEAFVALQQCEEQAGWLRLRARNNGILARYGNLLEDALARWKRPDLEDSAALLFPTGYAANLGTLGAVGAAAAATASPRAPAS